MEKCLRGIRRRGGEKNTEGVKRMEVCYIYIDIYRQHNETHKNTVWKKGKRKRRNGNIMNGVNLFKVHCMYACNYHNKIFSNYKCIIIQK
jgi:hypothetical protein